MKSDCHMHMLLDAVDWRKAIDGHRDGPDTALIRQRLEAYAQAGFDYLRDGGDRWGVGLAARGMAGEYGIIYRTPLAPLCKAGHYGAFIGKKYSDLKEYTELVREIRRDGGNFVKIMISGLMDFDRYGVLTEPGLEPALIRELIHIAHEEGFAVMAHANGARTAEAAALAGVDSIEHGAYLDDDALQAMKETGTIWCPTISTVANLRGKGRFREEAVQRITADTSRKIARFADMGGLIAPGSDAGAWAVSHAAGSLDEYSHLSSILGKQSEEILERGACAVRERF